MAQSLTFHLHYHMWNSISILHFSILLPKASLLIKTVKKGNRQRESATLKWLMLILGKPGTGVIYHIMRPSATRGPSCLGDWLSQDAVEYSSGLI